MMLPKVQPASLPSQASRHHSCALCHQRKVRCDKNNPCSYCASRGVACVPLTRAIPRPRKKRFPEAELLARLRRYETALKSYGADLDQINDASHETMNQDVDTKSVAIMTSHTPGSSRTETSDADHEQENSSTTPWAVHPNDVDGTESILQGSSDDEDEVTTRPIFATYNNAFLPDGGMMLFNSPHTAFNSIHLSGLHPSPVQIFQLWQIYLDNIQPLVKVVHAPTIQQKLLKCANNISDATPIMHGLLFGIYSAVVMSMTNDACFELLGEDKQTLLFRYNIASRRSLQKVGLLRSPDIIAQQAAVLTFLSMIKTIDPRSLLCMTASAEHNARRNGFHLNLKGSHIKPFETEMRRRLWWHIAVQQIGSAENAIAGPSAICWDWTAAFPLNVNETDLDPAMKTLPSQHEMPTDMIFCLVRYEIADFLRHAWLDVQKRAPDFNGSEFGHPFASLAEKLRSVDVFEQRLHVRYLHRCDSHIPLHIMTRYVAVYSVSKMKIAAYNTSTQPGHSVDRATLEEQQEKLMHVCIDAIEAYTACCTNRDLEKFAWFLTSSVPFLAYVHLIFNLRYRPAGELADRAWAAVTTKTNVDGRPRWIWGPNPSGDNEPEDSAMQLAFAKLTVKAWEMREVAASRNQHPIPVPALVVSMREKLEAHQDRQNDPVKDSELHSSVNQPPRIRSPLDASMHSMAETLTPEMPLGNLEFQFPMQDMPVEDELVMFDAWNTLLQVPHGQPD